jgi:hypothetical protein
VGFSLSWVAVCRKAPEKVPNELGLEPTGAREEFPESAFVGAELRDGWWQRTWFVHTAAKIQQTEEGEDRDVDFFFDVAVNLAQDTTGFRHDENYFGERADAFEVLKTRTSWLRKLFRG